MEQEQTQAQGMVCPHCHVDLVMSERQHVEIDYCPKCRGIWLDRGELDTIIDRAVAESRAASPVSLLPSTSGAQNPWPLHAARNQESYYEQARARRDDDDDHHRDGRHRRESFLQALFD